MLFAILNFLLIIVFILYTGSTSITFSLVLFYLIGSGVSLYLSKGDLKEKKDLLSIFNISFFVYFSYTLLVYFQFLEDNTYFVNSDQNHFHEVANDLGNKQSIKIIFYDCFIHRIHVQQEGAYFLFGSIAYIANSFFDGNSVLLQFCHATFLALFINMFVYKIIRFYVDNKVAYKYTIYYLLFAYILMHSSKITRDIHITLLFAVAIYIVHLKFTIKRLILLLILLVITLEFRFEHGLFYSLFLFLFLYTSIDKTKNKGFYKALFFIMFFGILIITLPKIVAVLSMATDTLSLYNERLHLAVQESGGIEVLILRLPIGIQQIARVSLSQINPFPPYLQFSNSSSLLQSLTGLVSGVTGVFWGYIIYVVLRNYKRIEHFPTLTKYLLFLVIAFLILNTFNMTLRRIIAVYPITYIYFVSINSRLTTRQKKTNRKNYLLIYTGLLFGYELIRFIW